MLDHDDGIRETYERIRNRFVTSDFDEELKEWANDELAAIQTDLDQVVRGDDGYAAFLRSFLSREHERSRLDDPSDTPYEEPREQPLCTCNDLGCELKRGKLPLAVQQADTIDDGIQRFTEEHHGDPIVLDHDGEPPGARQRWSEKRRDVWHTLRRIQTYLTKERDGLPEALQDETDASEATAD